MSKCNCLKSSGCAQCGTLEYVCTGLEIYWQDCSKTYNKYVVDEVCHDTNLILLQIKERVKKKIKYEEMMNEFVPVGC